jgi:hypothetical protein
MTSRLLRTSFSLTRTTPGDFGLKSSGILPVKSREPVGKRGRSAANKTPVLIAAQADGRKIGRIRLAPNHGRFGGQFGAGPAASHRPGTCIEMDDWSGYNRLGIRGYGHKVIQPADEGDAPLLPRGNLVASLLKRWLLGTRQGVVRPSHLDYYLDEFTFRFNRRTSGSRGMLFYRRLQQAVALPAVTGME